MNLIYRVGLFFLLYLGLYFWWSRNIYRKSKLQRGFEGHVRPRHTHYDLRNVIRSKEWRKDTILHELGDAIGWPRYFEEGTRIAGRDCDEFAVWILDAARDEFVDDNGRSYAPVGLLTVLWRVGWKAKGHNVALLKSEDDDWETPLYWHCSNWRNGHLYGPFPSPRVAAANVASLAEHPPLAWSLRTADLKKRIDYRFVGLVA